MAKRNTNPNSPSKRSNVPRSPARKKSPKCANLSNDNFDFQDMQPMARPHTSFSRFVNETLFKSTAFRFSLVIAAESVVSAIVVFLYFSYWYQNYKTCMDDVVDFFDSYSEYPFNNFSIHFESLRAGISDSSNVALSGPFVKELNVMLGGCVLDEEYFKILVVLWYFYKGTKPLLAEVGRSVENITYFSLFNLARKSFHPPDILPCVGKEVVEYLSVQSWSNGECTVIKNGLDRLVRKLALLEYNSSIKRFDSQFLLSYDVTVRYVVAFVFIESLLAFTKSNYSSYQLACLSARYILNRMIKAISDLNHCLSGMAVSKKTKSQKQGLTNKQNGKSMVARAASSQLLAAIPDAELYAEESRHVASDTTDVFTQSTSSRRIQQVLTTKEIRNQESELISPATTEATATIDEQNDTGPSAQLSVNSCEPGSQVSSLSSSSQLSDPITDEEGGSGNENDDSVALPEDAMADLYKRSDINTLLNISTSVEVLGNFFQKELEVDPYHLLMNMLLFFSQVDENSYIDNNQLSLINLFINKAINHITDCYCLSSFSLPESMYSPNTIKQCSRLLDLNASSVAQIESIHSPFSDYYDALKREGSVELKALLAGLSSYFLSALKINIDQFDSYIACCSIDKDMQFLIGIKARLAHDVYYNFPHVKAKVILFSEAVAFERECIRLSGYFPVRAYFGSLYQPLVKWTSVDILNDVDLLHTIDVEQPLKSLISYLMDCKKDRFLLELVNQLVSTLDSMSLSPALILPINLLKYTNGSHCFLPTFFNDKLFDLAMASQQLNLPCFQDLAQKLQRYYVDPDPVISLYHQEILKTLIAAFPANQMTSFFIAAYNQAPSLLNKRGGLHYIVLVPPQFFVNLQEFLSDEKPIIGTVSLDIKGEDSFAKYLMVDKQAFDVVFLQYEEGVSPDIHMHAFIAQQCVHDLNTMLSFFTPEVRFPPTLSSALPMRFFSGLTHRDSHACQEQKYHLKAIGC